MKVLTLPGSDVWGTGSKAEWTGKQDPINHTSSIIPEWHYYHTHPKTKTWYYGMVGSLTVQQMNSDLRAGWRNITNPRLSSDGAAGIQGKRLFFVESHYTPCQLECGLWLLIREGSTYKPWLQSTCHVWDAGCDGSDLWGVEVWKKQARRREGGDKHANSTRKTETNRAGECVHKSAWCRVCKWDGKVTRCVF